MSHQPPRNNGTVAARLDALGGFGAIGRREGVTRGTPRRVWALARLAEGWRKIDIAHALGVSSGALHLMLHRHSEDATTKVTP